MRLVIVEYIEPHDNSREYLHICGHVFAEIHYLIAASGH